MKIRIFLTTIIAAHLCIGIAKIYQESEHLRWYYACQQKTRELNSLRAQENQVAQTLATLQSPEQIKHHATELGMIPLRVQSLKELPNS